MSDFVLIKEIFESIQGEGPYIGANQLFIRFSKCNLACSYCDTDFSSELTKFSLDDLVCEIEKYKNIHSVSLTGGEPLLDYNFLSRLLPLLNKKIYLETNGTLYEELNFIISYVDIISMDLKLNSSSNNGDLFHFHEKFVDIAVKNNKDIFLKIVFDENITDFEIQQSINLAKKYNILIVLQPKMNGDFLHLSSDFINQIYYKFVEKYYNVRLIPQTHKFLNVR